MENVVEKNQIYFNKIVLPEEQIEFLNKYSFSFQRNGADFTLGTLKIDSVDGIRTSRLKSTKFSNILVNWKEFLFETIPITTGAVLAFEAHIVAGVLIGIQALKSLVGITKISFDNEASELILILHELCKSNENRYEKWIKIVELVSRLNKNNNEIFQTILKLQKVGVVDLSFDNSDVILIERVVLL